MHDKIPYQVIQGASDPGITAENMEKSQHRGLQISTKIRLMKVPVWPVATYSCESWIFRKNEETRLDAFDMKGLRKILRFHGQQRKQMSGPWPGRTRSITGQDFPWKSQ